MTDRPERPVWRRNEVDSPCVQICMIHPDARICVGCYRTTDEIAGWSQMSPETRQDIMASLAERKSQLPGRRGGRKGRKKG